MLERLVDWLIFSRPEGKYIYRLDSHIRIHIRIHIYIRLHIRLHWYEPLSWGISSYTNGISNGPEAHDAGTHATPPLLQMYMSRRPRVCDCTFSLCTLLFSSLLSWIFRPVHSNRTIVNAHGSPHFVTHTTLQSWVIVGDWYKLLVGFQVSGYSIIRALDATSKVS
jgi:hypothetical protein